MDRATQQQTARNESVFRDVNQAIERGHWPGEEDAPITFCCECGRLGCSQMLELTVGGYRRVRENKRRFIVAPGHEIPDVERVVDRTESYFVVEKTGPPGRVAETASEG